MAQPATASTQIAASNSGLSVMAVETTSAGANEYAILVTERTDGYELNIRELLLRVRAPDLRLAYEELMQRKRELLDLARSAGMHCDLPAAQPAPAISLPR